eukprot:7472164-Alexandrium_andersonii.AAC.1
MRFHLCAGLARHCLGQLAEDRALRACLLRHGVVEQSGLPLRTLRRTRYGLGVGLALARLFA